MAKSKEQKREILNSLADKIERAKSMIFTSFNGLAVKDNEELRRRLKAENSEYYVVKKTLLNLALQKQKTEGLKVADMSGQIAAIFGYKDEIAPARIVGNFQKDYKEKIDFAGGVLEGKYLPPEEVEILSKLPGKQELCTRLVGAINAPVSGLVNVLAGNLRNLLYALKAIEEKIDV